MTEAADPSHGAFSCCGVRIDALPLSRAADFLVAAARGRLPVAVHVCNAYVLSLARTDADYARLLNRGDLNVADGAPVAWIGRRLGFDRLRERASGTELLVETMKRGTRYGLRHYLYGSTDAVVRSMGRILREQIPDVSIVGMESPPFRPLTEDEEEALLRRLDGSGASIVWVGLGTPRQDLFVDRFAGRSSTVMVPVGAAFDFLAGTKARAPRWMRRHGMEWLHRLLTEPRRLWRRYLLGNVGFLMCAPRSRVIAAPSRTTT